MLGIRGVIVLAAGGGVTFGVLVTLIVVRRLERRGQGPPAPRESEEQEEADRPPSTSLIDALRRSISWADSESVRLLRRNSSTSNPGPSVEQAVNPLGRTTRREPDDAEDHAAQRAAFGRDGSI